MYFYFFMPLPINLSYSVLKSEFATNYVKNLENFKTGKQHQSTKTSPNQQTTKKPRQPRKLPSLLGIKSK